MLYNNRNLMHEIELNSGGWEWKFRVFWCFGCSLYFGFVLYFGFDFHMYFGLRVSFWEGCSGFLAGFRGFVGLGCFQGRFGCLMGASSVFWAMGVLGAPCGFRVDPCGFVWVFSFCELALVVPMYTLGVLRGALRFLIKSSYLKKKKKV